MSILSLVDAHYSAVLGPTTRRATFRIDSYEADVLKWAADANPLRIALYASLGASRERIGGPTAPHRVEFIIGFSPECDDAARSVAMVALDPAIHGSRLGPGQTVSYPDPLWKKTEMRTMLVLRPNFELVPRLDLADGTHVEFLQLVPLFPTEQEYKQRFGVDQLMKEFEAAHVEFWNPLRSAVELET